MYGRYLQRMDSYTSLSSKGLAVDDYFICPLSACIDLQVHDILDSIKSKDVAIDSTITQCGV